MLKGSVKIDIQIEEKDVLRAFVRFDDHQIQLVGFSAPVPSSTMERTISVSNWKQEDKLPLQNHKTHIICYYEGENSDPTEQLISLYKTAFAFSNFGLLGILDEDAWNCMPTWMIVLAGNGAAPETPADEREDALPGALADAPTGENMLLEVDVPWPLVLTASSDCWGFRKRV